MLDLLDVAPDSDGHVQDGHGVGNGLVFGTRLEEFVPRHLAVAVQIQFLEMWNTQKTNTKQKKRDGHHGRWRPRRRKDVTDGTTWKMRSA